MASFLRYLEPPNCNIMPKSKKYMKSVILLNSLYIPYSGTMGHARKPARYAFLGSFVCNSPSHMHAEIQYKRKDPQVRLILCNSLDTVNVGETVMLRYHSGMRAYQHNRNLVTSNDSNCFGGFYYTSGDEA